MNDVNVIDREAAVTYASWFRSLGDATRVQILNLLARSREPLRVGEIVAAVDVGQSTVSQHLKVLAEVGFVLVEHRGTASLYRVNESCISCFPSAADLVMGRLPARAEAPWKAA
jgi:DNA-binding transcriptional ArsR family regulator